jgi:hypothetical protein
MLTPAVDAPFGAGGVAGGLDLGAGADAGAGAWVVTGVWVVTGSWEMPDTVPQAASQTMPKNRDVNAMETLKKLTFSNN